jgi:hypothetical protein
MARPSLMIPAMSTEKTTSLSAEIKRLETLYEVGDYRQVKSLAKELIDTHAPKGDDRARIDKVLKAARTDPGAIVAFAFTLMLLMYLFLKYGT